MFCYVLVTFVTESGELWIAAVASLMVVELIALGHFDWFEVGLKGLDSAVFPLDLTEVVGGCFMELSIVTETTFFSSIFLDKCFLLQEGTEKI